MKKFLLFFIAIIFLKFTSAQTNVYHPFPTGNATWRETLMATDGTFGINIWENEKFIDGDTVLGGMLYHKIYETGLCLHCSIPCFYQDTLNYYYRQYVGTIREDASKRIYTYAGTPQVDTLLYDFNVLPGDTIPDSYNHMPAAVYPITVISIDSVYDGVNYRKRFILSGNGNEVIEGIGTTRGLFIPLDAPSFEIGGTLHCFIQNDTVRYTDGTPNACEIVDGTNNFEQKLFSVSISPNPFHTSAKLEIENEVFGNGKYQLKIFNTLGTLVREEKILHITSYILHRGSLNEGIYFYKLTTKENEPVGNGRFIIE